MRQHAFDHPALQSCSTAERVDKSGFMIDFERYPECREGRFRQARAPLCTARHCDLGHRVVHCLRQDCGMILSFRDGWLREFFVNDIRSKKIPSDLEDHLFRKIQMIDDATTDRDLRSPPSNHFEKVRGNLDGLHSIRVNKRWRLVFRWNSGRGEAEDLYLDDHSYE
jgi:proteic killer suppression protein